MHSYQNPVIPGYNPDPSICRVGEDYYLVTSTFEFFPGVPIYHSRNLADWEPLGHCLTRDSQLDLENCRNSGGVYAPTLRWHEGVFYMTTTNVTGGGNFIVHTRDIRGEWSDPAWVDQGGIDPSLLFDGGTVYFCSTCETQGGGQGIALCQVDPLTGERLSESVVITGGTGGKCPEAPHLYKIGGWYYLMLAEGGTEYGHMVTLLRSRDPYGPYEGCPGNPILSHRDAQGSPIQATGHADLVEDPAGNWWLVCLGIRPLGHPLLHNLGRETFLAPVAWDSEGWPQVGSRGRIALEMEGPLPAPPRAPAPYAFHDSFGGDRLGPEWSYVRNPRRNRYRLKSGRGLEITAGEETLRDKHPSFVGVRQKAFCITAEASILSDLPGESPQAGIAAYYNTNYHYALYVTRRGGEYFVELAKAVHDMAFVEQSRPIPYEGGVDLRIVAGREAYRFYYRLAGEWVLLGSGATAALCTEGTMHMTFTGTCLGLFASGTTAGFRSFSCVEEEE